MTTRTKQQREAFSQFLAYAKDKQVKVQIGVRGAKRGDDWLSVDLYDDSDYIDEHWDLHALPVKNNTVDAYTCNAVLEHVLDAELAVFEMFRTMKIGGHIWVEVPFMQYYHPTPGDFRRWTVDGLKLLLEDFEVIECGPSVLIDHEVEKVYRYVCRALGQKISDDVILNAHKVFQEYESVVHSPRIYSSVFCWACKKSEPDQIKFEYMRWKREKVLKDSIAEYSADVLFDPVTRLNSRLIR